MATATLISPSNPYHGHHTPFSSGHHHSSASGPSIAGMISPVEPRRHSDDNETSQRQSLPSLSEVISGAKPSPFPPSQSASTVSGSMHSFPSTYSSGPPRTFPEPPLSDKQSPRALHPNSFGPRPEPLPSFSESARPPPFTSRHAPPPISSFSGPQPSPPIKPEHPREIEAKSLEQSGPYHHPAHQHIPPVYHPHAGHLPPGQIPLPAYPVSPRHSAALPPPFESQRPPVHADEGEYAPARPQYDRTLNRPSDTWSYTDCLERVSARPAPCEAHRANTMCRLLDRRGQFSISGTRGAESLLSSTALNPFRLVYPANTRLPKWSAMWNIYGHHWTL